jgi:hypothetical protein
MARPVTERIFGGTPWPSGRMRLELGQLLADLGSWGSYRHDDVAEGFRQRANRVLLHLRSQPDGRHRRLPPDFEFAPQEYAPGAHTITADGAMRLEAFVRELAALIPGGGVEPRTALTLASLHPKVQSACAVTWLTGDLVRTTEAARDVVLRRLAALSEPLEPACRADGRALVTAALDSGAVVVGPTGGAEQEAVRALVRGLVEAVRAVPAMPAERFGADRAYELLALASLVLHRLEFAERVPPLEPTPELVDLAPEPAALASEAADVAPEQRLPVR